MNSQRSVPLPIRSSANRFPTPMRRRPSKPRNRSEAPAHCQHHELYRRLLQLRHQHLIPRLPGTQAVGTDVLGYAAVSARWRLGDGSELRIDLNLSDAPVVHTHRPTRSCCSNTRLTRPACCTRANLPRIARSSASRPQPLCQIRMESAHERRATEILASRAGLAVDWIDANGRPQKVAPSVLRAVLTDLGHPAGSAQEIDASLLELQTVQQTHHLAAADDGRRRWRPRSGAVLRAPKRPATFISKTARGST